MLLERGVIWNWGMFVLGIKVKFRESYPVMGRVRGYSREIVWG